MIDKLFVAFYRIQNLHLVLTGRPCAMCHYPILQRGCSPCWLGKKLQLEASRGKSGELNLSSNSKAWAFGITAHWLPSWVSWILSWCGSSVESNMSPDGNLQPVVLHKNAFTWVESLIFPLSLPLCSEMPGDGPKQNGLNGSMPSNAESANAGPAWLRPLISKDKPLHLLSSPRPNKPVSQLFVWDGFFGFSMAAILLLHFLSGRGGRMKALSHLTACIYTYSLHLLRFHVLIWMGHLAIIPS